MIKKLKIILFCLSFIISFSACGQNNERLILGRNIAEQELKVALTDSTQRNVVNSKSLLIKDSVIAINIAEPILFEIYGKENITKQRPYEIHFIDKYWVISGTLPSGWLGGTFLIIIDARNSKVIKITHGK